VEEVNDYENNVDLFEAGKKVMFLMYPAP